MIFTKFHGFQITSTSLSDKIYTAVPLCIFIASQLPPLSSTTIEFFINFTFLAYPSEITLVVFDSCHKSHRSTGFLRIQLEFNSSLAPSVDAELQFIDPILLLLKLAIAYPNHCIFEIQGYRPRHNLYYLHMLHLLESIEYVGRVILEHIKQKFFPIATVYHGE